MKKQAFTLWEALLVIAFLAIAAAILFPVFGRRKETGGSRTSCQSRLKQMGLGFMQYQQDYNEKFPLVKSGAQGWVDSIQPYIKDADIFQCPSDKAGRVLGTTDYFYNSHLAGQPATKLKFAAATFMTGDGIGNSPNNTSLPSFPAGWVTNSKSPAWRHLEGANYGYADGHVKWLKPKSVVNANASSSKNTFALW